MEGGLVAVSKNKKPKKKLIIFGLIALLIIVAGATAGIILTRQQQLIEQEASVPSGTAKITLTPDTKTIAVGESFQTKVYFDTAGTKISAISAQLEYPFTGDTPPIVVENITINPTLATDSMWDLPIKNTSTVDDTVLIKIAGFSSSIEGYSTVGQMELATITFKGASAGSVLVSFNATESKVTQKTDGADILMVPQGNGSYTVTGSQATATPSPTPSPTGSPLGTGSPTGTPMPVPVTGSNTSTTILISAGVILGLLSTVLFAL